MSEHFFARLRDTLADLYQEEADARRITYDAGVDGKNVSFSSKAITTWTAILLQTQKEGKIDRLMNVTLNDYPENKNLSERWSDYLGHMGDNEENKPIELAQKGKIRWSPERMRLIAIVMVGVIASIIGAIGAYYSGGVAREREIRATQTANVRLFAPTPGATLTLYPTNIPNLTKPTQTITVAPSTVTNTLTEAPISSTILSPPSSQDVNINGEWKGTIKGYGELIPSHTLIITLEQDGEIVTGVSEIRQIGNGEYFGRMNLRGIVVGTRLKFSEYEITTQNPPPSIYWCKKSGELEWSQSINGETLKGTWEESGCSSGTLELKKQK